MTEPVAGFGLGLRSDHYPDFIEHKPQLDFLEVISENYMVPGGRPLAHLDAIRRDYPMVMHGVSLSIGATDPLNFDYLGQLRALAQRIEPGWISDHLCFTGVDHRNLHDLLPMPYSEAALTHLVERISRVQDFLGRRIAIENVSSYVAYQADEMSEWDFLAQLARRADCQILLDVNNAYVNSVNHGFDATRFIDAMPADRICQIHMAGHEDHGDYIIDTHDHPICAGVMDLYGYTIEHLGPLPTIIERDDHIPPLGELLVELDSVRNTSRAALARAAARLTPTARAA